MGKGRRNREKADRRRQQYNDLRLLARKREATAKHLSIFMLVLIVLAVEFQAILQGVMYSNLNSGTYESLNTDPAEIHALHTILPTGAIGLALLVIGAIVTTLLICRKKPTLSLIGCGILVAGAAFFIPYVYNLGLLFPYDELAGVNGRGLSFWALIWQHYSTLFPMLLLIPIEWCAFTAHKKHTIADIMENVQNDLSTLSLDDE